MTLFVTVCPNRDLSGLQCHEVLNLLLQSFITNKRVLQELHYRQELYRNGLQKIQAHTNRHRLSQDGSIQLTLTSTGNISMTSKQGVLDNSHGPDNGID